MGFDNEFILHALLLFKEAFKEASLKFSVAEELSVVEKSSFCLLGGLILEVRFLLGETLCCCTLEWSWGQLMYSDKLGKGTSEGRFQPRLSNYPLLL